MTSMVTTVEEATSDERLAVALQKALGLDKVPWEQRELTLAIAKQYGLDPMLRHILLIEGRPYITRDGLLWVAHRSGRFDGIEVTDPERVDIEGLGKFWRARATVWRTDMSHPISYAGKYPVDGQNKKYGPEMAIKVAEVMCLRRAFNVSAPAWEERWEIDTQVPAEAEPEQTISERIAAKRAAIIEGHRVEVAPQPEVDPSPPPVPAAALDTPTFEGNPMAAPAEEPTQTAPSEVAAGGSATPPAPSPRVDFGTPRCDAFSPELGPCRRAQGHLGNHANKDRESWA